MDEKGLEERLAQLEQREREQAQFIADVSHELRTPLTVLRGGIEVAIERDRSADEYRQALSEALVEVQHLARISENLLFLTRGATGHVTLSFSRVELCGFMRGVVEEFQPPAHEKGVRLGFKTSADSVSILADRNRLKQVFHNLLDNAIRYTEKGSVLVAVRTEGGQAFVAVTDTGAGIEQEEMPYIFDRFFRSDRARKAYRGGSGLGLSIVRWIMEAHKGAVRVESRLGKGSTFEVSFPLIA
jgi:signal transduction histidine kinase